MYIGDLGVFDFQDPYATNMANIMEQPASGLHNEPLRKTDALRPCAVLSPGSKTPT